MQKKYYSFTYAMQPLGSSVNDVGVQVPSGAYKTNILPCITGGYLFCGSTDDFVHNVIGVNV